jgi:hypothetical protein
MGVLGGRSASGCEVRVQDAGADVLALGSRMAEDIFLIRPGLAASTAIGVRATLDGLSFASGPANVATRTRMERGLGL